MNIDVCRKAIAEAAKAADRLPPGANVYSVDIGGGAARFHIDMQAFAAIFTGREVRKEVSAAGIYYTGDVDGVRYVAIDDSEKRESALTVTFGGNQ